MNPTLAHEEWLANVESVIAQQRAQLTELRARLEQITARFEADRRRILLLPTAPASAGRNPGPLPNVSLPDVPRMA